MNLTVDGVEVGPGYVASVIAAIGIDRFLKLNPWMSELIPRKPKKKLTPDQKHTKLVLAHAYKEMARDLRDEEWSWSDIAQLSIKQRALDKRLRQEARDSGEMDSFDPTPDNLYLINTMFKFDHKPRFRHYEKDKKK